MRKITEEQLQLVLQNHKLRLKCNAGEWANLTGYDLRAHDLSGLNLQKADFQDSDLSEVDFRDSYLARCCFRRCNLKGADMRRAHLVNADLRDADLSGAQLRYVNLSGVYLQGAKGLPEAPKIANIDRAILNAIQSHGKLRMATWHTCDTTHCRAGWAIHLCGEAGYKLEEQFGPSTAGALIYAASRPTERVPDWGATDEEAMDDMLSAAGLE